MNDDIQTAANRKTTQGMHAVQISAAQIERLVIEYKKTRAEPEWAIGSRATEGTCAWWWGRKDALQHVFAELGIELPEEI